MKTIWGTLTTRRPIYVPEGRLGDLAAELGDVSARVTVQYGRALFDDPTVRLWGSEGAAREAVRMSEAGVPSFMGGSGAIRSLTRWRR